MTQRRKRRYRACSPGAHSSIRLWYRVRPGPIRRCRRYLRLIDLTAWVWFHAHATGRVRDHHFGEGNYEESEMRIRQLLAAAGGGDGIDRESVPFEAHGPEVCADWNSLKSPETYVGHHKAENFASPGSAAVNTRHVYAVPPHLRLNQWALSGEWTLKTEAAVLNAAGGRIAYRFHARDLHLIMGPAARPGAVPFRVRIDGQPPSAGHGSDVDEQGNGTVTERRLYQLIRQSGPISDRQFEIEFLDSAVEAFAFTFGGWTCSVDQRCPED
jgi:hypothetical protein